LVCWAVNEACEAFDQCFPGGCATHCCWYSLCDTCKQQQRANTSRCIPLCALHALPKALT
jgi:hypothetical protein